MDPYQVLGVDENADRRTIRVAYLKLVKRYHPDRYLDAKRKLLAEERLKQVNIAYALVKDGARTSHGDAYAAEGKEPANTGYAGESAAGFVRARSLIAHGSIGAAAAILDSIRTRNAEWQYLYGIIYLRRGCYDEARDCMTLAHTMQPDNRAYRNAYIALTKTSVASAEHGKAHNAGEKTRRGIWRGIFHRRAPR